MDPQVKIPMLCVDGSVREVQSYLRERLVEQGWKVISADVYEDLKKKGISYLPNFDQTIQTNKPDKMDYSTLSSDMENNVLEFDVL